MYIKNVVVGSGFAGSVIARRLAEEKNEEVLIIEKRDHIGGNAYDRYNEHGVLVHQYGPHIFHTNDQKVWDWLSRFTDWHYYQHRVLAYVDGQLVPLPINPDTINALLGLSLSTNDFQVWLNSQKVSIITPKNSEEVILSQGGQYIYNKFFKNYTLKQWGCSAAELDVSVTKRIPFRNNRDNRYFDDKYQGLPKRGYTALFSSILNHDKIHLLLNTNWNSVRDKIKYGNLYYSGALDDFFDDKFGKLPYRSLHFDYETFFDRQYYQEVGTVNYPNDYNFTRISEYKRFTGQSIPCTTVVKEYPAAVGEPYYIVPNKESASILQSYQQEAAQMQNVHFVGRLAEYKYYNMDQIVGRTLSLVL